MSNVFRWCNVGRFRWVHVTNRSATDRTLSTMDAPDDVDDDDVDDDVDDANRDNVSLVMCDRNVRTATVCDAMFATDMG